MQGGVLQPLAVLVIALIALKLGQEFGFFGAKTAVKINADNSKEVDDDSHMGVSTPSKVPFLSAAMYDKLFVAHNDLPSGTYVQVANFIKQRADQSFEVVGQDFQPSLFRRMLASLFWYIQMSFFAFAFAGDQIMAAIGLQPNAFSRYVSENKWSVFFGAMMLGNMLQSAMTVTHAFEIYRGPTLVWSSLGSGRIPQLRDLIDAFEGQGVRFNMNQ